MAAALAVRLLVLMQLSGHPLLQAHGTLDPAYYVDLAQQIAAGHDAPIGQAFFVSPLYVYFLALVFAATGGSLLAVKLLQVVLGAASVWLVWRTALDWFGPRAALVAASLAAACGVFAFYETILLQAALDPFLTALDLYLVSRAARDGGPRWFLAAGLALGLHALNRPNVLAYGLVLAPAALVAVPWIGGQHRAAGWRARVGRRGTAQACAYLCGLALVIAPIAIRNYHACGELVLISSHGGLNFYIGNNPKADGTYSRVEGITPSIAGQALDANRIAEAALGHRVGPSEASRFFANRAWQWIGANPAAALALFLRKLVYVFNAGWLTLNYSYPYYSRDVSPALRALVVGPWLLIPLGLLGLLVASHEARQRGRYVLWASFIPIYAVSVALFFVSARYRMPLLVPLAITSGAAIDWLIRFARSGARRLAAPIVALGLLAVAANWNLGLDDGLSSERTKMIEYLVSAGQDREAAAVLAATERDHPHRSVLLYTVSRAYMDRGDAARALPLLEQSLALEPDRPETLLVLGRALRGTGRARDAIEPLRRAFEANIEPGLALRELTRALIDAGRTGEAVALLRGLDADRLDATTDAALGAMALEVGDPALARTFLTRAVGAEPTNAQAQESLGLALGMLGRGVEAVAALESACRLDAGNAQARLNLAVVYANLGRLDAARSRAEEALRLRPDYERARELLAALNR